MHACMHGIVKRGRCVIIQQKPPRLEKKAELPFPIFAIGWRLDRPGIPALKDGGDAFFAEKPKLVVLGSRWQPRFFEMFHEGKGGQQK